MFKSRIKVWTVLAFLGVNILASSLHLALHHDGDASSANAEIAAPEGTCALCAVHHAPASLDTPQTCLSSVLCLNSRVCPVSLGHTPTFSLLGVAPKNSPPSFLA